MPEEIITVNKNDLNDVVNKMVSESVETQIKTATESLKDELQREIKSTQVPNIMQNIEVKNEAVDKHLLGTFARLSAKSMRERISLKDTIETVKDSYTKAAIEKIMTIATPSDGGFLVPTQYSNVVIDALRAESVVRKSGVLTIPMPNNNLSLRKWNDGTGEASWESENTKPTALDGSVDLLSLSGKKLIAEVEVSNELINDSTGLADRYIQSMLIYKIANKEDKTFLSGSGVGNIPKGLITSAYTSNTMTATPTYAKAKKDIIDLVKGVRIYNVLLTKGCFYMSPANYYALMSAEAPNNSTADFFKTLTNLTLFGYPVYVTTNIADDTILFGDAAMAVIGESQAVQVTASMDYKFGEDITVVKAISREDFGTLHDKAFAKLTGVTWSTTLS